MLFPPNCTGSQHPEVTPRTDVYIKHGGSTECIKEMVMAPEGEATGVNQAKRKGKKMDWEEETMALGSRDGNEHESVSLNTSIQRLG